jgi:hypothetical protein
MPLTYWNVQDAVNVVNGWATCDSRHKNQIIQSLEVYKSRGEFDGTMDSAYQCLRQAGYEFSFKCQRHINCQCKDSTHSECNCTPF